MAANGRPTVWSEEIDALAWKYINEDGWRDQGDAVPMVVGLCKYINVARSTVYDWDSAEGHSFSDILDRIQEVQELVVFSESLKGNYNATMAKLLLTKHGYSDKQEIEHGVNTDLAARIQRARDRDSEEK